MYTTNSVGAKVPNAVLNDHQLKYETFSTFSLGLKSSNWSAPKVDMLGFSTPLPMAMRITEGQNNVVITDSMWVRLLSSTNLPSFTIAKTVSKEKRQEEANGHVPE
ncbi:hypothetical protein JHK82_034064 [Glycine max]|nr:hypothetical protein JHK85_034772 [Glycine max]KAG4986443.1 hypothetical protein JHK86_034134 [Glycine max]KAG5119644.1 hypothetical protein JHK82_034064 [Glycine max]KAG5140629.1 hypothetical protein JHK84_034397 [Glycine max]